MDDRPTKDEGRRTKDEGRTRKIHLRSFLRLRSLVVRLGSLVILRQTSVLSPLPSIVHRLSSILVRRSSFVVRRSSVLAEALAIVAILAIAAWVRVGYVGVTEFKGDEARAMLLAVRLYEQGEWPLLGMPAAGGAMNPPLFIYLVATPLAFGRDAVLAAGWVGLLNVAAVLVAIVLARRHLGRPEALVVGLLYASSFWAAYYARKVWQPSFLPLFTGLFLLALFDFAGRRERWSLAWAIAWLGLAVQVHLSAVVFVPLLALALWLRRCDVQVRPVLAGFVLPALALIPFLVWELGHGFANLRRLVGTSGVGAPLDLERLRFPVLVISGREAHALAGERFGELIASGPNLEPLFSLGEWLFFGGMALFLFRLVRAWRRRDSESAVVPALILGWALLPLPFYLRFSEPLYPHYVLALYPLQFVAIAALVGAARGKRTKGQKGKRGPEKWTKGRTLAGYQRSLFPSFPIRLFPFSPFPLFPLFVAVVLALAAGSLWTFHRTLNWVSTVDSGLFGLPLDRQLAAAEAVRQDLERSSGQDPGAHSPLYLVADGSFPKTFDFLLGRAVSLKPVDAGQALVVPAERGQPVPVTRFLSTSDRTPAGQVLRQRFGEHVVAMVPYPGSTDAVRLYRLPPQAQSRMLELPDWTPADLRWDNGVRLLGYRVNTTVQAGQVLTATLLWSTGEGSQRDRAALYRFFVHLLDATGEPIARSDLLPYPVADWERDDLVMSWHPLALERTVPAGQHRLGLGMYDLRDLRRLALADSATRADIATVRVRPAVPTTLPPSARRLPESAVLAGGIALAGFDLEAGPQPGSPARLRLFWSTSRPVAEDLTVFVHLVGSDGRLGAQHDGRPAGGRFPTTTWEPGELVVDDHPLAIPLSARSDGFRLLVGMYQPATGRRVPLLAGPDAIDLGPVASRQ